MVRQMPTEAVGAAAEAVEVAAAAAEGWYPVSGATSCAWTWTGSCSFATTGARRHRRY